MRKHFVLLGILGLGVGLAGFAQQSHSSQGNAIIEYKAGTWRTVGCSVDGTHFWLPKKDGSCGTPPATTTQTFTQLTGTTTTAATHEMGALCEGSDQNTCRVSVEAIRESEKHPNHPAIKMGTKTQDSLYLYSVAAFTVEVISDNGGPYPFYPPVTKKAAKRFASGPAKPEAEGHTYHLVVHYDMGAVDPHIIIDRCAGHEGTGTC